MRDDVKITVDLEAEDTLAVKLKSLRLQGPKVMSRATGWSARRAKFWTSADLGQERLCCHLR